ncbi:hypothetical protein [Glaciihabitans sp. dw_435]|uniref:hypothetical protein n=1 Tax=Glaciihabitans sp. dw_435 TaxID=2720081 RepID=UPI001BD49E2B|nr:hypothetical protein [Glaciihabitans sp. dw_435]
MYSLNGVPLENEAYDWTFRFGSVPLASYGARITELVIPGRSGTRRMPSTLNPTKVALIVQTPRKNYWRLLLLAMSPNLQMTRTDNPNKVFPLQFLSSSPETLGDEEELIDVSLGFINNDVFWFDKVGTWYPELSFPSGALTAKILDGMTAPVLDAILRIKGGIDNFVVTDSRGSSFAYNATIPVGNYFRFEAVSGRAFVTTTDSWAGGTEVTGSVINGPGPNAFELTPVYGQIPAAQVSITSASRNSPAFQVFARRAFVSPS